REVLRYTEIAPVPGAPSHVLGIINLRGNVVTVLDMRTLFGLEPSDVTNETRVIVIETSTQVVGLMVDSVAEVVYLKSSEIDTTPTVGTDEGSKFIQGICNRNDTLLLLVNLNRLLTDDERMEAASK
ncbi:MAG: chemotaxis protein CheW, partial [Vibrionaceae bacterium]